VKSENAPTERNVFNILWRALLATDNNRTLLVSMVLGANVVAQSKCQPYIRRILDSNAYA
jgi:hypothetical protein